MKNLAFSFFPKALLAVGLGVFLPACDSSKSDINPSANSSGTGGSTARFTISGDILYAVTDDQLKTFDLAVPADPKPLDTVALEDGVETIFRRDDYLFLGTRTGMLIYKILPNAAPVQISKYTHITSCDPVVANTTHAYVTLRSGRTCTNGFTNGVNQLDVISLAEIQNPQLLRSYNMTEPNGMALDGKLLFLCDGVGGLLILDVTIPELILPVSKVDGIDARDVILLDGLALVLTPDNLYQYDYSDPAHPVKVSAIPVLP